MENDQADQYDETQDQPGREGCFLYTHGLVTKLS